MSSNYQNLTILKSASIVWTIENFSQKSDRIMSSMISLDSHTFHLNLFPTNKLRNFDDDVLVYLLLNNSTGKQMAIHCEMSIQNNRKEKCYSKEFLWNFKDGANNQRNLMNYISREYLLNPANGLMVGDKLTILCEVNLLEEKNAKIINKFLENKNNNNIFENYQTLLETRDLSDFILVVKTKEFSVHKAILGAQSTVFKAMFSNDLSEKRENRVRIKDMTIEVCEQLLSYIYSGKIPSLDQHTLDLFIAADRYQLEHLKSVCEELLTESLTIESVSNILVLADMHNGVQLRRGCIDFIANNSVKVMATNGWQVIKSRIELVLEILENISQKTQSFFE